MARGFAVEEWLVENATSVTAYVLVEGQCHKQAPLPKLECNGWTQDADDGLWRQSCDPDGGRRIVHLVVSVVNGQPAYVSSFALFLFCSSLSPSYIIQLEVAAISPGRYDHMRITFTHPNSQPPSAGTLIPPSSC